MFVLTALFCFVLSFTPLLARSFFSTERVVSGFIEPTLLGKFENIANIQFVREEYFSLSAGSVTSEGDKAAYADKVRAALSQKCNGNSIDGKGSFEYVFFFLFAFF